MNIVITSPHSLCDNNIKSRECDFLAGKAASVLNRLLHTEKESTLNSYYFSANILRKECDLNRDVCRDSDYRKYVYDFCKELKGNNILLDVHSFPNYYEEYNLFKKDEVPPEIVLLTGPKDNYNNISLSKCFYTELYKNKIRVKIMKDIKVLDILNQMNMSGILLEFNESLAYGRIVVICNIIKECIKNLLK